MRLSSPASSRPEPTTNPETVPCVARILLRPGRRASARSVSVTGKVTRPLNGGIAPDFEESAPVTEPSSTIPEIVANGVPMLDPTNDIYN